MLIVPEAQQTEEQRKDLNNQQTSVNEEISPQEHVIPCAPTNRYGTILYRVLPLGVNIEDIEEGMIIELEPVPETAIDNAHGAPAND